MYMYNMMYYKHQYFDDLIFFSISLHDMDDYYLTLITK